MTVKFNIKKNDCKLFKLAKTKNKFIANYF